MTSRVPPSPPRPAVRLVGIALMFILALGLCELGTRALTALENGRLPFLAAAINARLPLNPYQQPAPGLLRHWQLKPGWGADGTALAALKRASGRFEGAKALERTRMDGYDLPLVINSAGFKGVELSAIRDRPRVLAIGDSVTFGLGGWDWPHAMERTAMAKGRAVEAVNGGVEGYALRNAQLELSHYLGTSPDVCVIMLGWNDIYAENGRYNTLFGHFRTLDWLHRLNHFVSGLGRNQEAFAEYMRTKPKQPRRDDPEVVRYKDFGATLTPKAEALGNALEKGGCRVALATLPGLYRSSEVPSARALENGHLPEFTDNPYTLAAMAESYNDALRSLASRRQWVLVDFARWAETGLTPADLWFTDSVHMTAPALDLMGSYAAEALAPLFDAVRQSNDRPRP